MGKITKSKENENEKQLNGKISGFFKKTEPPSLFTKIGKTKKTLIGESMKSDDLLTSKLQKPPISHDNKSVKSDTVVHARFLSKKTDAAKSSKTPTKIYKNSMKRLAKPGISPCAKRGSQPSLISHNVNHVKRNILPSDNVSLEDDDVLCEILNELNCEELMKPMTTGIKRPSSKNEQRRKSISPSKKEYKESTVCPIDKFNRHVVIGVHRNNNETVLDVKSTKDNVERKCILKGFWCDSHVCEGDIVNILSQQQDDGSYIIDNDLFIINPDLLLSGTSIVSSVYCMRRSVLNEKFKGSEKGNVHMLYGSIIHCLFQKVLQSKIYTDEDILKAASDVLKLNKFIHEMYSNNSEESIVLNEIKNYIQPLKTWLQKHTTIDKKSQISSKEVQVTNVEDIEENIWSPRFGVKGKIDLTVQVKIPTGGKGMSKTKTVPLELKTGRTTYSVEHKGQVTLYAMMSSDRREDPEEGLLLYLKESSMRVIPAKNENKKGLLQLRNEMAYYISHHVKKDVDETGHVTYQLGQLPEPINNSRSCSKCPQLLNCAIYQRSVENYNHNESHAMTQLVPETLSHLSQHHLDYFLHWMLCMDLEKKASQNSDLKQLWCMSGSEREMSGDCLTGLVINDTNIDTILPTQNYSEGSDCLITFTRHKHYMPILLNSVGIVKNDLVVISTEDGSLLALSTGVVQSITDDDIKVAVDRDSFHTDASLKKHIFRLDKCNNFNTMGYLFTNIMKLMMNDPHSNRLRQLIIDKKKPEFNLTLSKKSIEQVKKHFKTLNKPQKTAILKVLMSKDYVLIKGFPGTGKTSTIVALVKILREMNQTVLLTSYTHSAVDNILLKLKQDGIDFLRLGRLARIHPDIHDYCSERLTSKISSVAELTQFYNSQAIVATSCLGVNHAIFTQRRFDVCIVDEASQVLQPACLGPIFLADKFILVGDSKQLCPVVQSREAKELGMEESLFVRLDNNGASYELNLQYRMNRIIMNLGNELVYEGALKCGNEVSSEQCLELPNKSPLMNSVEWLKEILNCDINMSAVFCNTKQVPAPEVCDKKGVTENPIEADLICIIIKTLIKSGINIDDIGVIAPYRSQVKLLHSKLREVKVEGLEVNTVDQYQGRDKQVILISFVKSNTGTIKSSSGQLLEDIRRLNVAVTRAKFKLIMIGDIETLQQYTPVATIISSMTNRNQIIHLPKNAHLR